MNAYDGMLSATENAPEAYKEAYRLRAKELIESGVEFTSDDITEVVGMPPNPNAVGGIMAGLVRQYGLETVRLSQMRRPEANRRLTRVYRRPQS